MKKFLKSCDYKYSLFYYSVEFKKWIRELWIYVQILKIHQYYYDYYYDTKLERNFYGNLDILPRIFNDIPNPKYLLNKTC